ncbi:MAG: hypothetical protein PWP15_782 [Methanothermococcus sp.]|uniref:class III signal peptide-containing protein n=1 Tax=Methanothermococcus sp. TaxID=2614238 RepID=UPI0025892A49|nr:class III signal peptide-containing protein [Methanothermococcus sp.]MDK2790275.1 hypothetical protein [Methanothermococcus sp.]
MRFLKKLASKKGQVSMEIGILVAAAVVVAAIAAYFYVKNVKGAAEKAGEGANATVDNLSSVAISKAQDISDLISKAQDISDL